MLTLPSFVNDDVEIKAYLNLADTSLGGTIPTELGVCLVKNHYTPCCWFSLSDFSDLGALQTCVLEP